MNAKKCDRCGNFYEGDGGYKKAGDFRLIRNGYFNDDYTMTGWTFPMVRRKKEDLEK